MVLPPFIDRLMAPLLVALMALPPAALPAAAAAPAAPSAAPAEAKQSASDVVLTKEGMLVGQVVDARGKAVPAAEVVLHGGASGPVPASTSERGHFAYRGVRTGVYFLETGDQVRVVRVWPAEAAPPSAQQGVLMVASEDAVSGQYSPPGAVNTAAQKTKRILTNPLAVAGIIATAVAIPVAIHNADDGS